MKAFPSEFATTPIVYAVRNEYQILVPVTCETVMWVQVGSRCFYDDSNGILRSATTTHRMRVPAELLDHARHYTVCYRRVYERKPYFSKTGEEMRYESDFRPIEGSPVHICHLSDAHNRVELPVAAGRYFGDRLDLLILNGDIPNHSGKLEYFDAIHRIASELTEGEIPVVFARGNHDTRGIYAERLEEHTPTDGGRSYYSFRVGHIWGIVLDCGEDKPDSHAEYGNTVCCEDFRRRQTEYLKQVIANADTEYAAEGVENRLVISHVPFTENFEAPFDIENDVYTEWCDLLRTHVRPQLMLSGHTHKAYLSRVGDARDGKGQPCPVAVSSEPRKNEERFYGGAITLERDGCRIRVVDGSGDLLLDETVAFSTVTAEA